MDDTYLTIAQSFAVIGILGSFTIMVTDWLGWTRPAAMQGKKVDLEGINSPFLSVFGAGGLGISDSRRYFASILGGLAMLPCALGFVAVFAVLSSGGPFLAAATVSLLGGTMVYGTLGHTMMGFINELSQSRSNWPRSDGGHKEVSRLLERAIEYWAPTTIALYVVGWLIGSALFAYMVLATPTGYPWWAVLVTPFLGSEIARNSGLVLPHAIARWVGPAHMHIFATLPLMILTALILWGWFN